MESKRDIIIDNLKGFTIILVVLGHAIQFNTKNFDNNIVFKIIYSFHMPLFMFLSGYVSFNTFDGTLNKLKIRFRSLILPFITWALVTFLYLNTEALYLNKDLISLPKFLWEMIKSPANGGLWFLWVLFGNYVILFLLINIRSLQIDLKILLALFILNLIVLLPINNYLGLNLIKRYSIFFFLGYIAHKYQEKTIIINKIGILSLVFYIILLNFWTRLGGTVNQFSPKINSIFSIVIFNLVPILAINFLLYLFRITSPFLCKYMQPIGKLSLEIYAIHYYFLYVFAYSIFQNSLLKVSIAFLIALIGSLFIQRIIKRADLTSYIFFGKKIGKT